MEMELRPDCDLGKLQSVKATLTLADTVYTYVIPNFARGFRLRPDAVIRWAIGEDPPAAEATKAGSGVETDYGVGNYAFANESEVRMIPRHAQRNSGYTLRLLSDTLGAVVTIEFWGG